MREQSRPDFGNLTIYGRNPVCEALEDPSVAVLRLHLARSNKPSEAIAQLRQLAANRQIPVCEHSKLELSRISRNGRQDQGVAADLRCASLQGLEDLLALPPRRRLIALDRINNPQNLGMAIRAIAASPCDGLLLSREGGNTGISPLVIKASAGTLLRTPIYQCPQLAPSLQRLQGAGYSVIALDGTAPESLFTAPLPAHCIDVLGNETDGVSPAVQAQADKALCIPMQRDVESLNVAVTAALVAFHETAGLLPEKE